MGRLELPIPDLANSLTGAATDLEAKIRAHVPPKYKDSVTVTVFRKGKTTGLAIEYDDRAENLVYAAIEYPAGEARGEKVDPSR